MLLCSVELNVLDLGNVELLADLAEQVDSVDHNGDEQAKEDGDEAGGLEHQASNEHHGHACHGGHTSLGEGLEAENVLVLSLPG